MCSLKSLSNATHLKITQLLLIRLRWCPGWIRRLPKLSRHERKEEPQPPSTPRRCPGRGERIGVWEPDSEQEAKLGQAPGGRSPRHGARRPRPWGEPRGGQEPPPQWGTPGPDYLEWGPRSVPPSSQLCVWRVRPASKGRAARKDRDLDGAPASSPGVGHGRHTGVQGAGLPSAQPTRTPT